MRDTFKILYIPVYIYNVPATKLCNKEKFSLKMLRRTIKVFYIYILQLWTKTNQLPVEI